jgi:hypothetical protein
MMAKSIILHADEIRPLLDCQPVTVRREVKPQPEYQDTAFGERLYWCTIGGRSASEIAQYATYCPGDVLRVRETFSTNHPSDTSYQYTGVRYKADGAVLSNGYELGYLATSWHSPATMPAWASRLTVRVRACPGRAA